MANNGKIYTLVMDKLGFDPRLDASNITVSIQGNHDIVLLSGYVTSFAEKLLAEKVVKDLAKIKGVANDIEVNISAKFKKSDIEIAKDVANALKSNYWVSSEDVKFVVKDSIVTLSGKVSWYYEKEACFNAIRNLTGVKLVINNIDVKPEIRIDAATVKTKIKNEFERHARIDAGRIKIEVDGEKIILNGTVKNFDEINDAKNAAWSIPGAKEVENNLNVEW